MGRPRTRNVAMLNGRITVEQMQWLQERADELGGNLSAALRQSLTDAQLLEMARTDYKRLRAEHPEFEIPLNDDPPDTRVVDFILRGPAITETADLELRKLEASGEV